MNRMYNKALLYQAYYSSKIGIFSALIIFSYVLYVSINGDFAFTSYKISNLESNSLEVFYQGVLLLMIISLTVIYAMMKGFNKRNTTTFLNAGPYKKEEIVRNELIILFIVLGIMLFIYLYLYICFTYKNYELVQLISNYWETIFSFLLKYALVGTMFILYLTLFDMLFSNTIVTIFIMGLLPIVMISNVSIYTNIFYTINNSIINYSGYIYNFVSNVYRYIVYGTYSYSDNSYLISSTIGEIIFCLMLIILLCILIKVVNKKSTVNNLGKLFSFKWVYNITVWLICFSVITFVVAFTVLSSEFGYTYLSGSVSMVGAWLCIIIIFIVSTIVSFICSKYLKKYIDRFI